MYYILLYHQHLTLLNFGIFLQHYMFVFQIHHLIHLLYTQVCSNHLELYIHNFLLNHFLLMDILQLNMLACQIFYQNEPMLEKVILVLHIPIILNLKHYFLKLLFVHLLNSVLHQMPFPHNVVTVPTQLNHFFIMRKIIVFDVVTFRFKFSQRTKVRLLNLNLMCLVKIQFFFAFVFSFSLFIILFYLYLFLIQILQIYHDICKFYQLAY